MAEFLVKAVKNYTHPDPNKDFEGVWKVGDIVAVGEDNKVWGRLEDPTKNSESVKKFVLVKCPEISIDTAEEHFNQEWKQTLTFTALGHDLSIDGHRYRVAADASGISVSGIGHVTEEQVTNFCNAKGLSVYAIGFGYIDIDVVIMNAVRAWRPNEDIFEEISYNQTTGEHIVQVNYTGYTVSQVVRFLSEHGATNLTPTGVNIGTFSILRSTVLQELAEELQGVYSKIVCRRIYYFDSVQVQNVLTNNNGVITITRAQFLANIKNRLEE